MSGCFICGGSGENCNICGEAPGACECSPEKIREYELEHGSHWGECSECNGGKR